MPGPAGSFAFRDRPRPGAGQGGARRERRPDGVRPADGDSASRGPTPAAEVGDRARIAASPAHAKGEGIVTQAGGVAGDRGRRPACHRAPDVVSFAPLRDRRRDAVTGLDPTPERESGGPVSEVGIFPATWAMPPMAVGPWPVIRSDRLRGPVKRNHAPPIAGFRDVVARLAATILRQSQPLDSG